MAQRSRRCALRGGTVAHVSASLKWVESARPMPTHGSASLNRVMTYDLYVDSGLRSFGLRPQLWNARLEFSDPRHRRDILMTSSPVCDPPEAVSSELNGLCILIVEDSWDVGTGLKMLLESWGAVVTGPAATTADAARLVRERTPDVALVDINLRDGEQSYCLINQLHDQGIRVVVISGYADVSPSAGKVVAVLQKPIREGVLIASIRPVIAP